MSNSQNWTDLLPTIDREAADIGLEPAEIRTLLLLRASGLYARLIGPKAVVDLLTGTDLPTDKNALEERLIDAESGLSIIPQDGTAYASALEIVERHLIDPVAARSGVEPHELFVPLARAAADCFLAVSSAPDSPIDAAQVVMIGCRPLVGRNPIPMLVPGRRYAFADGVVYLDGRLEQAQSRRHVQDDGCRHMFSPPEFVKAARQVLSENGIADPSVWRGSAAQTEGDADAA